MFNTGWLSSRIRRWMNYHTTWEKPLLFHVELSFHRRAIRPFPHTRQSPWIRMHFVWWRTWNESHMLTHPFPAFSRLLPHQFPFATCLRGPWEIRSSLAAAGAQQYLRLASKFASEIHTLSPLWFRGKFTQNHKVVLREREASWHPESKPELTPSHSGLETSQTRFIKSEASGVPSRARIGCDYLPT